MKGREILDYLLLICGAILAAAIIIIILIDITKNDFPNIEEQALTNNFNNPPKGYEDKWICSKEDKFTYFDNNSINCNKEGCYAKLIEEINCIEFTMHRILIDPKGNVPI